MYGRLSRYIKEGVTGNMMAERYGAHCCGFSPRDMVLAVLTQNSLGQTFTAMDNQTKSRHQVT